jgi:hypothetical protein
LIKPIQRILKYPLLLQQLRNLTDERSEEHQHLIGNYRDAAVMNSSRGLLDALNRERINCRGAQRHGKSGGAHKRDAENSRRVRCYFRPLVQATPKILQTGETVSRPSSEEKSCILFIYSLKRIDNNSKLSFIFDK